MATTTLFHFLSVENLGKDTLESIANSLLSKEADPLDAFLKYFRAIKKINHRTRTKDCNLTFFERKRYTINDEQNFQFLDILFQKLREKDLIDKNFIKNHLRDFTVYYYTQVPSGIEANTLGTIIKELLEIAAEKQFLDEIANGDYSDEVREMILEIQENESSHSNGTSFSG